MSIDLTREPSWALENTARIVIRPWESEDSEIVQYIRAAKVEVARRKRERTRERNEQRKFKQDLRLA